MLRSPLNVGLPVLCSIVGRQFGDLEKAKAILGISLYGQPIDIDRLFTIVWPIFERAINDDFRPTYFGEGVVVEFGGGVGSG